jgi:subtilisin family serine protease
MYILLIISLSFAKLKVAVMDTGFNYEHINSLPTCVKYTNNIDDDNGHGTNVAGLIQKHAGKGDYCFYIYKVFLIKDRYATIRAIENAIHNGVHIINYSGGGLQEDLLETAVIKKFLDKGGVFIAASGNNSNNLSKKCNYYPACSDSRITVVANTQPTSNYGGPVDIYLNGKDQEAYNVSLSGSSQSTAVYTGMFINYFLKNTKVLKQPTDK